ncbi:hypothetical protein [Legionella israelensis]|nr:hypothetical protein [Legionella israelensis]
MPLLKGYYYDGEPLTLHNKLYMFLGAVGAAILIFSLSLAKPQAGYIIGSACMLIVALHYKLVYFIALEIILIAGHTAFLLGIGPKLQVALPCLLSFQLFVYYLMTGQLRNPFLLIGVSGIGLLSIGFAFNNQWIFFIGSTAIAIYACYSTFYEKFPCFLWAILNTIFAVITLLNLLI